MSEESVRKEFGFTNNKIWYERAVAWREAAVADGWSIRPTYEKHEPVERAAQLMKEGFACQILTRDNSTEKRKYAFEATVNVWAPDGMSILVPDVYDWQAIKAAVRTCSACGASDVDVHRYSFAGRCCEKCLPELKAKYEKPGWDN